MVVQALVLPTAQATVTHNALTISSKHYRHVDIRYLLTIGIDRWIDGAVSYPPNMYLSPLIVHLP